MKIFQGKRKHILLLAALIVYLLAANPVYVRFFLKHGKPVQTQVSAAPARGQIKMAIDSLTPTVFEGEEVYEVKGWAFMADNPDPQNTQIRLVLHSTRQDLVFETMTVRRPGLTTVFPDYQTDLSAAGFRALIAQKALAVDNYQIGILLEKGAATSQVYELSGKYIERSPNRLRFITDD